MRPLRTTGLRVKAGNDYTAFVSGIPKRFSGALTDFVWIKVISGDPASGSSASYLVAGTYRPNHIKARFGDLGSIDMTFHPRRKVGHFDPSCFGRYPRGYPVREGIWRGTIDFTGEGGFTTVSAFRAKPTFNFEPRECRVLLSGDGGFLQGGTRRASFAAYQNDGPGNPAAFSAYESEGVPGVLPSISREVWVTGLPQTFTYNHALTQATVEPPPPFQGTGTFQGSHPFAGPGTFTGTLAASFPGGPTVALPGIGSASLSYANVSITHGPFGPSF